MAPAPSYQESPLGDRLAVIPADDGTLSTSRHVQHSRSESDLIHVDTPTLQHSRSASMIGHPEPASASNSGTAASYGAGALLNELLNESNDQEMKSPQKPEVRKILSLGTLLKSQTPSLVGPSLTFEP
jgi:hypothetical protein